MSGPFVVFARPAFAHRLSTALTLVRSVGWACPLGVGLTLSGCYFYPAGFSAPPYSDSMPVAAGTMHTAPSAVPDAQYPGPLYSSPPVAIAVPAYPVWSAWPAYYPWPAWGWGWGWGGGWGWGWGAPAFSFGFSYRSGGGHWHH
ncbi:hypothetical protein [Paraburkholderia dinghuensis]|uniref:Uncharacterized protein n=1 Tax=Paraburkholderia dinghuensis TaxID=2305225 RepID=A0A3N6N079_9BURK|nr:hypothetical protein [Paraburkholderia dinghuensis]RQH07755.1 hypothetical protein D1Y85_06465 [Paraburkholderia dinghuensis]